MHLRVIQDDHSTADEPVYHVWAGLQTGSPGYPLWSDRDFIEQLYSFIIGTGTTREAAILQAKTDFARALEHIPC